MAGAGAAQLLIPPKELVEQAEQDFQLPQVVVMVVRQVVVRQLQIHIPLRVVAGVAVATLLIQMVEQEHLRVMGRQQEALVVAQVVAGDALEMPPHKQGMAARVEQAQLDVL